MFRGERRARRLLLGAGVVCGLVRPAGADPGDPALVARIFEGLGVRAQISTIVPDATEQLLGAPWVSEPDRRAMGRIVARGFAPDRLERAGLHAFLGRLESARDLERARIAARWLEQASVRRVHAALATSTPAACQPDDASDVSVARLRMIDAIERTAGSRARIEGHAETVVRNMSAAADALLPASQRIGRLETQSRMVDGSSGVAAERACPYAGLSNAELRSALGFIESDVGRWLYEAVPRALDEALGVAARRTARELIGHFEGRARAAPVELAVAPERARRRARAAG